MKKSIIVMSFLLVMVSITFLISSCKKDDPQPAKPAPVANFTFTGDSNPAPCEVSFTNSSTNATSYSWEFGDGATSIEQNPKHTYTAGGTFSVKLTATGQGVFNSTTKNVTIQNSIPAPVANFTFTGDNKPAPCEVSFTNTSTDATSFNWEFGDGATSIEQNPKHTYSTGGTFNVKLTATGVSGNNSITKGVTIQNPVAAPVANFTFTGDNNFAPCKVTFTNTSTNAVTYSWNFGDSKTSTLKNPSHVFANGGTFNVTLTATNSVGIQNVINKTVTIKNVPTKLKINSIILTAMSFTDPSGGGWDLGSGPDPYFVFTDINSVNYLTTPYISDVLQTQLPLTYTLTIPYLVTNLDLKYIISCRDDDLLGYEEIWKYDFTVRDWMPTNGDLYPTTLVLESVTNPLKFTLNVEWVE